MATFQLTVPDEKITEVVVAIQATQPNLKLADGGTPSTPAQWCKAWINNQISLLVTRKRREDALKNVARDTNFIS